MPRPINQEKLKVALDGLLIDTIDTPLIEYGGGWARNGGGYLVSPRLRERGEEFFLHRAIMRPGDGFFVDHINGNKLDNRRKNLRIVSKSQNQMNTEKRNIDSSSKFKGVHFMKRARLWQVYINKDKNRWCVGYTKHEKIAALLYDFAARQAHGEFARLNFPLSYERGAVR